MSLSDRTPEIPEKVPGPANIGTPFENDE